MNGTSYYQEYSLLSAYNIVKWTYAVFFGQWSTPPHPSIPTLSYSSPLTLIIPIHIDDGLAVSNSLPLYNWFVTKITKKINFVCLGAIVNSRYLGQHIICNCSNKTIRISQSDLINELLEDWGMKDCKPVNVPLSHNLCRLPSCSPNACSDISDQDITISYQHLVGSLTYLAICTCPDISYAAMSLGQYNASPTHAHLVAAKGVLHYLAGTLDLSLSYSFSNCSLPASVQSHTHACGLSDVDWASDETD
jgi:hypothetical protein